MKFIPDFITSRIQARLKEMSIGDMIDLCHIPIEYNEQGISKAIAAIVTETNLPVEQWTGQERYAALLHYYLNMYFDGQNTQIANNVSIMDYFTAQDYPVVLRKHLNEYQPQSNEFAYLITLDTESDTPDSLWMIPLTGEWLEAIERVVLGGYVKGVKDKTEAWRIAQAAAQILPRNVHLNEIAENYHMSPDQFISNNINMILNLPSSRYNELMAAFDAGQKYLDHLVYLRAFNNGFVLEGGNGELPPYRFQFITVIDAETSAIWARDEITGRIDSD